MGSTLVHASHLNKNVHVVQLTDGGQDSMPSKVVRDHPYLSSDLKEEIAKLEHNTILDERLIGKIRLLESLHALHFLVPGCQTSELSLPYYNERLVGLGVADRGLLDNFIASICPAKDFSRTMFFIPSAHDCQFHTKLLAGELFAALNRCCGQANKPAVFSYLTPWYGPWNLYDFEVQAGTKLASLIGNQVFSGWGKGESGENNAIAQRYFISKASSESK